MGLRLISQTLLSCLPPFYAGMLSSFAYVNNLFYQSIDTSCLPQNLWLGCVNNFIDYKWCAASYLTAGDLPTVDSKLDLIQIIDKLMSFGSMVSPYLRCCAFQ